ncbi:MAG: dUTP diphosphatase [Cellvibrionaceae bacterium]|nr:dUTP diphosphatase [Cellvibrionaceae bacterium]MCV6625375.1 dUTP diphosphatase [Cellvibrionaceae bacterium]
MTQDLRTPLRLMLDLQDDMNTKVHPDWRGQNFEWYRAIWIECGELLDHYGWKWWKKQSPDTEQVRLELIDIWHFGLSILLTEELDKDRIADQLAEQIPALLAEPGADFRLDLEAFAGRVLTGKSFDLPGFIKLLNGVGLDMGGLYRSYVGKNVLNFFRQDHGYKDGSYQKIWAGREDNEHLVEALAELDTGAVDFPEQLYQALAARYPS